MTTWVTRQLRRWRCMLSPWHRAMMRQYPNGWIAKGPIIYCRCGNVYRGIAP